MNRAAKRESKYRISAEARCPRNSAGSSLMSARRVLPAAVDVEMNTDSALPCLGSARPHKDDSRKVFVGRHKDWPNWSSWSDFCLQRSAAFRYHWGWPDRVDTERVRTALGRGRKGRRLAFPSRTRPLKTRPSMVGRRNAAPWEIGQQRSVGDQRHFSMRNDIR